jgi:hypothetical protein
MIRSHIYSVENNNDNIISRKPDINLDLPIF